MAIDFNQLSTEELEEVVKFLDGDKTADINKISDQVLEEISKEPEKPSTALRVVEETLPLVGAIGGGIAGGALGLAGGPAAFAGRAVGSGIGASIGALPREIRQTLAENQPYEKALKDLAVEFGFGVTGEGFGSAVGWTLGKLGAKKAVPSLAKKTAEIVEKYGEKGTFLPATAQLEPGIKKKGLELIGTFAQSGLFSGGIMEKAAEKLPNAYNAYAKDLINTLTKNAAKLDPIDAGKVLRGYLQKGASLHDELTKVLYKDVEKLGQFTYVDTAPLKNILGKASPEVRESIRSLLGRETSEKVLGTVEGLPNKITWEHARLLRSEFGRLSKSPEVGGLGMRTSADAANATEQMMKNAVEIAKKSHPETGKALEKAWKTADSFFKLGIRDFDNDFIVALLKEDKLATSKIMEIVFKDGNYEDVLKVFKAIKRAEMATKRAVKAGIVGAELPAKTARQLVDEGRRAFIEHTLSKPAIREIKHAPLWSPVGRPEWFEQVINPSELAKLMQNPKWARTAKLILEPAQLEGLKEMASIGTHLQKLTPKAGGAFQLAQYHQALSLLVQSTLTVLTARNFDWGKWSTASAIFGGPVLLALGLRNRMLNKVMLKGLVSPINKNTASTFGQLGTKLAKEFTNWLESMALKNENNRQR